MTRGTAPGDGGADPLARDLAISSADAARLRGHGALSRAERPIADADGGIGRPWRRVDLLDGLAASGRINAEMREAGDAFRRQFRLAALDPLKARGFEPAAGASRDGEPARAETARRAIAAALTALGGAASPAGSCAWHVLGAELSLRAWALRRGWNGRQLRQEEASGILIAALAVLAAHWSRGRPRGA
jgi:hypothetical protein